MPRLLLIEDDVMIGSGTRLALRQEGLDVDWVQDRAGRSYERLSSIDWLRNRLGRGIPFSGR